MDSCLCACQVELVFWIPIVSGIPDSMSFIPDSTSKNFPDSGIRVRLHGAGLENIAT